MQSFSLDHRPGDGGQLRTTAVAIAGSFGGVSEGQVSVDRSLGEKTVADSYGSVAPIRLIALLTYRLRQMSIRATKP